MHGRVAQLHGVASVAVGPPKDALRVGEKSHILAVFGKRNRIGGNSPKEGLELFGLQVIAGKLPTWSFSHRKYLLSVPSRNQGIPAHGTIRQLNWVGGWATQQR